MAKREIKSTKVDATGTESLRGLKKLSSRNRGDLSSALICAAAHAKKSGVVTYVYPGNSYMHAVHHVSVKLSDAVCRINCTGSRIASVTPDLELRWHEIA
jgi:hypothetical protein